MLVAPAPLLAEEEAEAELERQAKRQRKEREHPPTPLELAKTAALQGIIDLLLPVAVGHAKHLLEREQDTTVAKVGWAKLGGAPIP